MSDFHFIRPWWLLLIPSVVWIWYQQQRRRRELAGWSALIDPRLLPAMTVRSSQGGSDRTWLILAVWIATILSVAGPTWHLQPSPLGDTPEPVMIVFRATESMNQTDIQPSRLERARLKVVDFARARQGKPMGLIAYAGSPHLVLPPTRDTELVAQMIDQISSDIMPRPGSDLSAALELAVNRFGKFQGSICLVCDQLQASDRQVIQSFRDQSSVPIEVLAIARAETPELNAIEQAARSTSSMTVMSADNSDIETLVRRTNRPAVPVEAPDSKPRWSESGYWLVPLIAAAMLVSFRKRTFAKLETAS